MDEDGEEKDDQKEKESEGGWTFFFLCLLGIGQWLQIIKEYAGLNHFKKNMNLFKLKLFREFSDIAQQAQYMQMFFLSAGKFSSKKKRCIVIGKMTQTQVLLNTKRTEISVFSSQPTLPNFQMVPDFLQRWWGAAPFRAKAPVAVPYFVYCWLKYIYLIQLIIWFILILKSWTGAAFIATSFGASGYGGYCVFFSVTCKNTSRLVVITHKHTCLQAPTQIPSCNKTTSLCAVWLSFGPTCQKGLMLLYQSYS